MAVKKSASARKLKVRSLATAAGQLDENEVCEFNDFWQVFR